MVKIKEFNNKQDKYALAGRLAEICSVFFLALVILAQSAAYLGWQIPISAQSREEFLEEQPFPVTHEDNSLFANIRVEAQEGVSLPSAYVKINGVKTVDFAKGSVLLRVYEGDYLEIDCSSYDRALVFKITGVSTNLRGDLLPSTVKIRNGVAEIGVIYFK